MIIYSPFQTWCKYLFYCRNVNMLECELIMCLIIQIHVYVYYFSKIVNFKKTDCEFKNTSDPKISDGNVDLPVFVIWWPRGLHTGDSSEGREGYHPLRNCCKALIGWHLHYLIQQDCWFDTLPLWLRKTLREDLN